jgi:hypothetical protein
MRFGAPTSGRPFKTRFVISCRFGKTPERRTLALRFFGDDATYRGLPPVSGPYDDLIPYPNEGDRYRAPHCPQIR